MFRVARWKHSEFGWYFHVFCPVSSPHSLFGVWCQRGADVGFSVWNVEVRFVL